MANQLQTQILNISEMLATIAVEQEYTIAVTRTPYKDMLKVILENGFMDLSGKLGDELGLSEEYKSSLAETYKRLVKTSNPIEFPTFYMELTQYIATTLTILQYVFQLASFDTEEERDRVKKVEELNHLLYVQLTPMGEQKNA